MRRILLTGYCWIFCEAGGDCGELTRRLSLNVSDHHLVGMAIEYGSDPARAKEYRLDLAYIFYNLSIQARDIEKSHDYNQLAMAMVWDLHKSHPGCLETTGFFPFNEFMNQYLSLAYHLKRNEITHPPIPPPSVKDRKRFRVAVATVCDYKDPSHVLFGIDRISKSNRDSYTRKHGYYSVFLTDSSELLVGERLHPVWSAIALPLKLIQQSDEIFDWVMWMDCDALFVNQSLSLEDAFLLPNENADLIISEDGRGLSGGNWIVRNSDWSRNFLKSILENSAFNQFNLKDQFGMLWTLLGPATWAGQGGPQYPPQVALAPQWLMNAYPYALCRPSHHCFEDGKDFIVSFITLGSQSREMAWHLLNEFAHRSN